MEQSMRLTAADCCGVVAALTGYKACKVVFSEDVKLGKPRLIQAVRSDWVAMFGITKISPSFALFYLPPNQYKCLPVRLYLLQTYV